MEYTGRLKWAIKNQLLWFNPTMSPAPKSDTRIECPVEALKYYSNYVKTVTVQTKHMGSYCSIYHSPKLEECKFFSRNGYPIVSRDNFTHSDLLVAYEPLHRNMCEHYPGREVILEAELMPWSLLGEGLIEKEFRSYEKAIDRNLKTHWYLTDLDLDCSQFLEDKVLLTKEDFKAKYRSDEIAQYTAMVNLPNYEHKIEGSIVYQTALDSFGSPGEIEFKPFGILKVDDRVVGHSMWFDHVTIDVDDHDSALYLFLKAREEGHEGIVIKPTQYSPEYARAFKVRTNEYLHLIYGEDFGRNFWKYHTKRHIKRKLQTHLKEWKIMDQLIRLDRKDAGSEEYVDILGRYLKVETTEEFLDRTL